MKYADIRRLLAETAMENGAKLRSLAQVVDIRADGERPYVTLASGEVLSADVLVGADGEFGVSRALVLEGRDDGNPTGLALYE